MFEEFPKIARLSRGCVITEKIDGTNAQVHIVDEYTPIEHVPVAVIDNMAILAGSRNRYLTEEADNHGFAKWVAAHAEELLVLGPGRHYGEWWGSGIQRGYGLTKGEKKFSLFNVNRFGPTRDRERFPVDRPACCEVVPVLYEGPFGTNWVEGSLQHLISGGSQVARGFMRPEGVVIWHEAARVLFKKTIDKDSEPKKGGQVVA